jgi:hypothetical protein
MNELKTGEKFGISVTIFYLSLLWAIHLAATLESKKDSPDP